MSEKTNLIVVNYVMDSLDPLLSHQIEAVNSLASNFDRVTVITGRVGEVVTPPNVKIIDTGWEPHNNVSNVFNLVRKAVPVILRGNFQSVFFHMTDLQCAILAPWIRLRGKKQVLWYAHTANSFYLRWAQKWVNIIVTSTKGSYPLTGKKVQTIGQAINPEKFSRLTKSLLPLDKLVHIGRLDKSKRIDLLIEEATRLNELFNTLTLTIIGGTANNNSRDWASTLVERHSGLISSTPIQFKEAIPRDQFPSVISEYGCFFHAYMGSLDKTLVESTMMRIPVVSINPEYLRIFGQWSNEVSPSLIDEYLALRELSVQQIDMELNKRRFIAERDHSLENWTYQLSRLLK